jgi:metal-dependent amidase/aminoacylase/carboxypeptidase family protein
LGSHDVARRLRRAVQDEVNRLGPDLFAVSRFLHANPELAYAERQAADLCTDVLARHGVAGTRGVANLPTALIGLAGSGAPRIALMAEYDALANLGHACGHNLIGTASLGAAVAGFACTSSA